MKWKPNDLKYDEELLKRSTTRCFFCIENKRLLLLVVYGIIKILKRQKRQLSIYVDLFFIEEYCD